MQKLARRVEKPHTQMTCSRCSPGRVAPYSSTAYCSLAIKGRTLQMRHRAHDAPKGYYCSGAAPLPKYAKTYRRTALLAPPRRESPKQARTRTKSAQRRSRAKKAITARADVVSLVHLDRTALLEYQTTSSSARACTQTKIEQTFQRARKTFTALMACGDRAPRILSAVQI